MLFFAIIKNFLSGLNLSIITNALHFFSKMYTTEMYTINTQLYHKKSIKAISLTTIQFSSTISAFRQF